MNEKPGQDGGAHDAEARKQHGGRHDGLRHFPVRTKAAVKHDEYQSGGTNLFGEIIVFKINLHHAV